MKDKSIVDLEREWTQRLIDSGFRDIENTNLPERPLIQWHSFDLVSEATQSRKRRRDEFTEKAQSLANNPQFQEILELMVKHGNSRFDRFGIEFVWERHVSQGWSERRLAEHLSVSKSCIHFILVRMREWMNLI